MTGIPDRALAIVAAMFAMFAAGGAPSRLGETTDSVGMSGAVLVAVGALARFMHEYRTKKTISVQDLVAAFVGALVLLLGLLGQLGRLAPDVDVFATASAMVVGVGAAARSFSQKEQPDA